MNRFATIGFALAMAGTLAGCDSLSGGGYSASDAQAGASFRHHARDVVAKLNLKCPYTVNDQLLSQYGDVEKRYAALKESIAGRSFETDLVSAEADYEYLMAQTELNCADPDGPDAAEKVAQEVAQIDAQLGQLEKIVGGI
jgi:hypothetical protein